MAYCGALQLLAGRIFFFFAVVTSKAFFVLCRLRRMTFIVTNINIRDVRSLFEKY